MKNPVAGFACKLFSWRVEPAYSCLYHGVRTSCRSDSILSFGKAKKEVVHILVSLLYDDWVSPLVYNDCRAEIRRYSC